MIKSRLVENSERPLLEFRAVSTFMKYAQDIKLLLGLDGGGAIKMLIRDPDGGLLNIKTENAT